MFSKTTDFLLGREHRFVRDYLLMSSVLMIGATALGFYLSRGAMLADPMPTASIASRTEVDSRIYSVVRSVLGNGEAVQVTADRSLDRSGKASGGDVTGSLGDDIRRVTIDPCTGETKR
jgi:hypothetical protein